MATFTYVASYEPVSTRQPRVLSVKFGDGYEQRSTDGINADLQKWSLTFKDRTTSEATAIESFFVTNVTARVAFDWTPPGGTLKKWLCRSWRRTIVGFDDETISAEFEEVADP